MLCSFSSMFCVVTIVSRRLFCVLFCFCFYRMFFSSSLLVAEGGGTGKREKGGCDGMRETEQRDRQRRVRDRKRRVRDGNKKSKGRNENSEGQKQLSEGHN